MNEQKLMQLALELAKKGGYKTFPNPNVGAIIWKDGKVIGRGFHKFFGDKHAEINALDEAGSEAKNSTLIVTLEPCSHFGKTPPCVEAIVKAGVTEVIVGLKDPNPLVNGQGIKILKDAGIKVKTGILQKELKKFYRQYSMRFNSKKSFVVLKYAMSLDGKIASVTGDAKWISSEKSRKWVHNFRTSFDGILVGVKTIIQDNPTLSSHGTGKDPIRIILDPKLDIPLTSKVLNDDIPTVIIYSDERKKKKLKEIEKRQNLLIKINEHDGLIDFRKIINELRRISIFSVLIEGGGFTAWNALTNDVVDEIVAFVSPKIIGGANAVTPVEGEGIEKIRDAIKTKIMEVKKFGEDVFIRSKIIRSKK